MLLLLGRLGSVLAKGEDPRLFARNLVVNPACVLFVNSINVQRNLSLFLAVSVQLMNEKCVCLIESNLSRHPTAFPPACLVQVPSTEWPPCCFESLAVLTWRFFAKLLAVCRHCWKALRRHSAKLRTVHEAGIGRSCHNAGIRAQHRHR